jgi:RNA 2',3'-cyclic 3'-phosphodiesterase
MRLFAAITPPAAARAELEALAAPLRPAWPELRWTSRDAWHLTLAFLGEVEEVVLPPLRTELEQAAHGHPSLELSIRGAGAFSAAARARVLWAGIHGDRQALAALAASVAAAARRAGARPPDQHRTYEPHLTLARCRVPADVRPLVQALGGLAGLRWRAAEIHLIRSHLDVPPRYEIAGSWPLRART